MIQLKPYGDLHLVGISAGCGDQSMQEAIDPVRAAGRFLFRVRVLARTKTDPAAQRQPDWKHISASDLYWCPIKLKLGCKPKPIRT
jgi:hypothetical protein